MVDLSIHMKLKNAKNLFSAFDCNPIVKHIIRFIGSKRVLEKINIVLLGLVKPIIECTFNITPTTTHNHHTNFSGPGGGVCL